MAPIRLCFHVSFFKIRCGYLILNLQIFFRISFLFILFIFATYGIICLSLQRELKTGFFLEEHRHVSFACVWIPLPIYELWKILTTLHALPQLHQKIRKNLHYRTAQICRDICNIFEPHTRFIGSEKSASIKENNFKAINVCM